MDESILLWINQGWTHPWLDVFFAWISQTKTFSLPLFLIACGYLYYRFGNNGVKFWLLIVGVVILSDQSGVLIKSITKQPRPCAVMSNQLHTSVSPFTIRCSRNLNGMPSNHALNFFTFTAFSSVILRTWSWTGSFILISTLVSVSRIYLGVHYPSQVMMGMLLGIFLGAVLARVALRYLSFLNSVNSRSV